jgi:predicted nucleic acid-binding protein
MAFVADASVTAAWFLPSQANAYTDSALARLADEPVRVPCLWPFEFANLLAVLERRKKLTRAQSAGIIERLRPLPLAVDSAPPAAGRLLELARDHALSAYDAGYLELALRLGVPLASKDGPLRAAAQRIGVLLEK